MKKYFKLLSLFLGLLVCTPAFVACGGDDDDDSPSSNNNSGQSDQPTPPETDIVGTWNINLKTEVNASQSGKVTFTYDETMSFNADNSFSAIMKENQGYSSGYRYEGNWSRLGTDRVIVDMKSRFFINQDGSENADPNFYAHKDTLSYFFKGNALFCESVVNDGHFAYTRSGELPYNGYGDYANSPVLGVWVGEDFASDGTPITLKYELTANGTFAQTEDNHRGWSEGLAGYYILDNNRIMFISYYFTSKMNSDDNKWEVIGYRMWGGHWIDFKVDGVKLYLDQDPGSMSGEVSFLVKEGEEAGSSLVGHWKSTETYWIDNKQNQEDEYWEIESDKTVRHWWIRNGAFAEGTMGTYELTEQDDKTYINCHWSYWLKDSGNNTNPSQGEATGREDSDYKVRYIYSKISDILVVEWQEDYGLEHFKRIK